MTSLEVVELRLEERVIAAPAVDEDERWIAGAFLHEVKPDAGGRRDGHRFGLGCLGS